MIRSCLLYSTLFLSFFLNAAKIEDHFKKIDSSKKCLTLKGIDFIYLINLDKRSERLQNTLDQLDPYGISPYRFSAVYGAHLSQETLCSIGLPFAPHMESHKWVLSPSEGKGLEFDFLRSSIYGTSVFSKFMNLGALGCSLSHLSILQDAYDAGYQTIWVMEDDIKIVKNPHELSSLIEKLDSLDPNWDLLYTDKDEYKEEGDIPLDFWWMWRPDFTHIDRSFFAKREKMNEDFTKISSRTKTHSMIMKRSGIKKILDHVKEHHLFVPYDHEIAFAKDLRLYMLNYPVVSWLDTSSDIQEH